MKLSFIEEDIMEKKSLGQTVQELFQGMDQVVSTKTVVGEPQVVGDVIIVPLVDVSFGLGAGTFSKEKSDSHAGGIGGKVMPSAILIIKGNETRLVNVRDQDTLIRALDLLPSAVSRISSLFKNKGNHDPSIENALEKAELPAASTRETF
jgi:uncharacterized spore protein YtfJ